MGDLFVDDNNTIDDDGVDDFDGKSVVLDILVELHVGPLLVVALTLVVIFVVAKVLIAEVMVLPCVLMVIIGTLPVNT